MDTTYIIGIELRPQDARRTQNNGALAVAQSIVIPFEWKQFEVVHIADLV